MKSRFSRYNDGMLYVCEQRQQDTDFSAVKNARSMKDLNKILKLAYEEKSKRDEDIQFAESIGRSLSMKVKTRSNEKVDSTKKITIGDKLYSIINIDHDRTAKEMYLYLEEERTIKWVGDEIAKEYYRDEMPEYGVFPPELYVEVLNKEEISAIMAYAYKENIPVVCRGAGTGLAGGATCKYGGIMLSVMRMNKIFPIDRKNQTITAEPGALLIDIQAAAAAGGLFYPPDPGEKTASIGGNVITNAGGMKAVRYGLTRDFVRCIEAVMPDGSIMNFSSNVVKNTTGYDVKDLVIGSEGTLCILTQVTLKLLPAPTCTCTLVMPFRSLEECADMVPKVLELPFVPTAIEFLERELIDIVERNLNKMFPVKQGEAVLIVMYDASSKQELDSAVEAAAEAALANGALDCCIAGTPERAGAVWSVRGGILEGMKADSIAQEECDVVVPRARIAEYVKAAKKIASAHGIRVEPCGHCGDGNIHTEMLRGPEMSDQEWKEATHASLVELYALSKELGGQLSGEHGIGNGRLEFLEEFAGPRMIALYKAIKLAFDDKLILNPGKVIEYNK